MKKPLTIFWFRRDLRLEDNVGLAAALQGDNPVLPIFIFDTDILDSLPRDDHRVTFIWQQLDQMNKKLKKDHGSGIAMYHGNVLDVFKQITKEHSIEAVYTNHDYEPTAKKRDKAIADFLNQQDIEFNTFKDQVIFEKLEITKGDGGAYKVYTPYMRKWKQKLLSGDSIKNHPTNIKNYFKSKKIPYLSLADIGFEESKITPPAPDTSEQIIEEYSHVRNFPGLSATSKIGTYLRFGTISIRKLVAKAHESDDDTYLNELIWREFFMQILWNFPYSQTQAFKPAYDSVSWRNDEDDFEKWKNGQTGYPLVDAGMRELNQTGYMHNRVRMVTASFLVKHLLIDWKWGEAYFAKKLLDYELASNNGNWQWSAGTGCDSAPYFRIFNPESQLTKFDKGMEYVETWAPEYLKDTHPEPMVDHKFARERCLETYKKGIDS